MKKTPPVKLIHRMVASKHSGPEDDTLALAYELRRKTRSVSI